MDEAGDGEGGGYADDDNRSADTDTGDTSGSLLDSGETGESEGETGDATHSADGRPDYIKDQFWNKEAGEVNLEALAKSQADFERKARQKLGDVPAKADEYEVALPDGVEEGDGIIEASKELALKYGMSKESYKGFMEELMGKVQENTQGMMPDPKAEMAKLGEHGKDMIGHIVQWADHLKSIGLLSEGEREAINAAGVTAEGVQALNKIREHYTRTPNIPTNTSVEDGLMSAEEFYAAVGSEKYRNDTTYRAKVEAQGRKIFGDAPAGTSPRGLGVR